MYASLSDLVSRFGEARLIELTTDGGDAIDAALVDQAIADAGAEIDSYLRPRHKLPLPMVPARLVGVCCDLARYRLYQRDSRLLTSEQAKDAHGQAITWLRELAAGKVDLGLDGGGAPVKAAGGARLASADRIFSRRTLRRL
jgi:phage gp36-like protein